MLPAERPEGVGKYRSRPTATGAGGNARIELGQRVVDAAEQQVVDGRQQKGRSGLARWRRRQQPEQIVIGGQHLRQCFVERRVAGALGGSEEPAGPGQEGRCRSRPASQLLPVPLVNAGAPRSGRDKTQWPVPFSDRSRPVVHTWAANNRHMPGTPRTALSPRSVNSMPEPATRGGTDDDTRTSPGSASAKTRAAMCTAMPPTSSSITSTSPVWRPPRSSSPMARTASRRAPALRMARPGPSKVARTPSPVVPYERPVMTLHLLPGGGVMGVEELGPIAVTPPHQDLGRTHDVGEQDRRQNPLPGDSPTCRRPM